MHRVAVLVACLLALFSDHALAQTDCNGVFDFYFVLDSSGSLRGDFVEEVVPFVRNVVDNFVNPDLRVSFITFADRSGSRTALDLTRVGDTASIDAGFERLLATPVEGETFLGPGLRRATDQMEASTLQRSSVILMITDGRLSDFADGAVAQADHARTLGARIFAIGLGGFLIDQLTVITANPRYAYDGTDSNTRVQIIETLINETCVEITSATPLTMCLDDLAEAVTLMGRGFTNELNPTTAVCQFKVPENRFLTTKPEVQFNQIVCPMPTEIKGTAGEVLLRVMVDGVTFIPTNVTLTIGTCGSTTPPGGGDDNDGGGDDNDGGGDDNDGGGDDRGGGGGKPKNLGFVAGIILGLLALLLLLALFLLWCCFPVITCAIVGGLPPEPEEPEPEPEPAKPGRKWDVVDASYYGRGGAGGIAPMTVRWGKDGATEEGSKLTKAKDANVVTVIDIPETPAVPVPPKVKPGCWELFKRKVKRWYAVAASYRPVRGETKWIVCCPGPHHGIYSPKAAQASKPKTATNRVALERKSSSQAVLQIPPASNGNGTNVNGTTNPPPQEGSSSSQPPSRPPRRQSAGRNSVMSTDGDNPAQNEPRRPSRPAPPRPPPYTE